jgi:hypothetical protein
MTPLRRQAPSWIGEKVVNGNRPSAESVERIALRR